MTTHLRYAIGAAVPSLINVACATALTLDGEPWLGLIFLASAILLAWDIRREAALHRRRLTEHHLAKRRSQGEIVPALDPCCLLHRASKGAAHDYRCTLPGAPIHVPPTDDTKAGWTAYERLTGRAVGAECTCGCGRPWSVGGRS